MQYRQCNDNVKGRTREGGIPAGCRYIRYSELRRYRMQVCAPRCGNLDHLLRQVHADVRQGAQVALQPFREPPVAATDFQNGSTVGDVTNNAIQPHLRTGTRLGEFAGKPGIKSLVECDELLDELGVHGYDYNRLCERNQPSIRVIWLVCKN